VVAAYNEAAVIPRALADLRRSYYPASRLEVIAVNDGSTDEILQIMRNYARDWPQLRVISQPPSGKSSALNNGIDRARPESTVIVTLDADTLFLRSTIRTLARHFIRRRGNRIGAVVGHVKVGNRRNILTAGRAWNSSRVSA
jgi:cellulose synthase/poly-beta-1,6-N-acetylglucosamine synthase-like glycosyltransferase